MSDSTPDAPAPDPNAAQPSAPQPAPAGDLSETGPTLPLGPRDGGSVPPAPAAPPAPGYAAPPAYGAPNAAPAYGAAATPNAPGAYPPPAYGAPNAAPAYGAPPVYGSTTPAYGAAPAYGAPAYGAAPASGYGYGAQPKTNVLAIISLIASIVGFIGFLPIVGSLAGIITGHIALGQVKTRGENGRGLALAGTIVGYVGLALWIIGTILFFAFIAFITEQSYISGYSS